MSTGYDFYKKSAASLIPFGAEDKRLTECVLIPGTLEMGKNKGQPTGENP